MKKLLILLHNITNPTASERAKVLFRLMPNDTGMSINTLECLKALIDAEMIQRDKAATYEKKLINQYLPKTTVKNYDACFEPLKN